MSDTRERLQRLRDTRSGNPDISQQEEEARPQESGRTQGLNVFSEESLSRSRVFSGDSTGAQQTPFTGDQRTQQPQRQEERQDTERSGPSAREALMALPENEGFRELSYPEQKEVRHALAMRFAREDEQFQAVPDEEKPGVLQQIINQPPVFDDPEIRDYGKQMIEDGSYAAVVGHAAAYGLANSGSLGGLLTRTLGEPVARAFTGHSTDDILMGSDADKLREWISQEADYGQTSRVASGLGTVTGAVHELVGFMGAAGIPSYTAGANVGARLASGMRGRWMSSAIKSFSANTAAGAVASTYSVATQELAAHMQDRPTRISPEEGGMDYGELAKSFGWNFAADYAISALVGSVGVAAKAGGRIFQRGRQAINSEQLARGLSANTEMDVPTAREAIRSMVTLDLSDDVARQLPTEMYDNIMFRKKFADFMERGRQQGVDPSQLREYPVEAARAEIGTADPFVYFNDVVEDGATKFRYYEKNVNNDDWFTTTFDNLTDLKERAGRRMVRQMNSLEAEHGADFVQQWEQGHDRIVQWGRRSYDLDTPFNPRKSAQNIIEGNEPPSPKNFVEPETRPYITRAEAQGATDYAKQNNWEIHRFQQEPNFRPTGREVNRVVNTTNDLRAPGTYYSVKTATPQQTADVDRLVAKARKAGSAMDDAELRKIYGVESGYDALRRQDGSVEFLFPKRAKTVSAQVDANTGKLVEDITPLGAGSQLKSDFATTATIRQTFNSTVGPVAAGRDFSLIGDLAAKNLKGTIKRSDVEGMVRSFVKANGNKADNIVVRTSRHTNRLESGDRVARATLKNGQLEVQVPKSITDSDVQTRVVRELFGDLKNTAAPQAAITRYTRAFEQSAARMQMPIHGKVNQDTWLKSIVRDKFNGSVQLDNQGRYMINLPGQAPARFSSAAEAYDELMLRTMDPSFLKWDMGRQGYKVSQAKNGQLSVVGPGLDGKVKASSMRELMDQINYRPQQIDEAFGPRLAQLQDGSVQMTFDGQKVAGSKAQLHQHLNNFADTEHISRLSRYRSFKNADILKTPGGAYEVDIPKTGSRLTFTSQKEALRFAKNDWDQFTGYKYIADNKGLNFTFSDGRYVVEDGTQTLYASNKEELYRVFQKYPDLQGGPDILEGIDPDALTAINTAIRNGEIPSMAHVAPLHQTPSLTPPRVDGVDSKYAKLGDWYNGQLQMSERFFESIQERFPGLTQSYRNLETARKIAQSETNKVMNGFSELFRDTNGRLMKRAQRVKIGKLYEARGDETKWAKAVEAFGEPTARETQIMDHLNDILGRMNPDGTATGLAAKFGIGQEMFEKDYLPRFRGWFQKNGAASQNRHVDPGELLEKSVSREQIGDLEPFFRHMRTADAEQFAREDDLLEILRTYTNLGHKYSYMDKPWNQMRQHLNQYRESIPGYIKDKTVRYMDNLSGSYRAGGMDFVSDLGETFAMKLGFDKPHQLNAARHVFESFMSMNYLANMAIRPFLAIRNAFQPFVTLPQFENGRILQAYRTVVDNPDIINFLKASGDISNSPPVLNAMRNPDSLIGRATQGGLKWFSEADVVNRAVSYTVGTQAIDEGLDKLSRGVLRNMDEFRNYTHLDAISPDVARKIEDFVTQGGAENIAAARHAYGSNLIETSQFGYRASQTPDAFNSHVVGKLFGQYGTWSAGYRAIIARNLQYGSTSSKVARAARFIGNQAALYGAFTALGVNARNFLPLSPALFGGGPNFDLAVNMATMFDTGFKGERSRYEVARSISPVMFTDDGIKLNAPRALPVGRQAAWIQDGVEYYNQGDIWKAFLSWTMTPVARETN